jgi:hypothetical protein
VLVGDVVMLGSSKAVAEGTSELVGARLSAGAASVLAGRQPEISTANAARRAVTVNNRRKANKLTFQGTIVPVLWGMISSYYKDYLDFCISPERHLSNTCRCTPAFEF